MNRLSSKQRAFVEAYLTCWNGHKAAIDAGYSEASARHHASRLLRNDTIRAAIAGRLAELHISANEVLERLTKRARSSIADVLRISDGTDGAAKGSWALDLAKAKETGGIHQIKKLKEGKYGIEIEMYDPLPALELLGRHYDLFSTGDDGILKYIDLAKLSPEQLQRLAAGEHVLSVLLSSVPPALEERGA